MANEVPHNHEAGLVRWLTASASAHTILVSDFDRLCKRDTETSEECKGRNAHHAGVQVQDVLEGEHGAGWPAQAVRLSHLQELALAVSHAIFRGGERPEIFPSVSRLLCSGGQTLWNSRADEGLVGNRRQQRGSTHSRGDSPDIRVGKSHRVKQR